MREGAKTGNRRASCRLVPNLGHREGMIMLLGGWGGPGGAETSLTREAVVRSPEGGLGSCAAAGNHLAGTSALIYTRCSAANTSPVFEIKKPNENELSSALFPSNGGFLAAAADLSH